MRRPFKVEIELIDDPRAMCFMHGLSQVERDAVATYLSAIVWHAKLLRAETQQEPKGFLHAVKGLNYQPTVVEMLDAAADGHRYVEALIRGGLGSQISDALAEIPNRPNRFAWLWRFWR